jgi:hypothetical protein
MRKNQQGILLKIPLVVLSVLVELVPWPLQTRATRNRFPPIGVFEGSTSSLQQLELMVSESSKGDKRVWLTFRSIGTT